MVDSLSVDARHLPVTGLEHRHEEKLHESTNPYIFTICSAPDRGRPWRKVCDRRRVTQSVQCPIPARYRTCGQDGEVS